MKVKSVPRCMLIAGLAWLGGCTAPHPAILSGPDPADPGIGASHADPAPVDSGNSAGFPVAPLPWDLVNRRVAPGAERGP